MIYFDNAATSGKKPQEVIKAVEKCLKELSANPGRGGHTLSVSASEAVFSARKKIADFFGVNREERVIFTPSCTHGLNYAIKGVMRKGDHIIISSMEHNAVARPVETLKRMGAEVDIAEIIFGDINATVRSFERHMKKNTRAVVCLHASNVTGEVFPIKEIGEICRKNNVLFIVDGAQTAGILPINCEKMCIDFLSVAPHKGLYAPMGTGILIANSDIPFTIIEGGTGVASALPYQPDEYPERMESGTVNLPGIMGISAGIDFINQKGMKKMYNYEMELMRRLYKELSKMTGVIIYSPPPETDKAVPVLSFNLMDKNSEDVANRLNSLKFAVRPGLHCAPFAHKRLGTLSRGTVRVSPSVFNNMREIDMFLESVERINKYSLMRQ